MTPLSTDYPEDYFEMKARAHELTMRYNAMLRLTVTSLDLNSEPKFTFAEQNAKLGLPNLAQLLADIKALKALAAA